MKEVSHSGVCVDFESETVHPERMRWQPQELPSSDSPLDFVGGLQAMAGAGSPKTKTGLAVYLYSCAASMTPSKKSFYNADGDMLVVPQSGPLHVTTETGRLHVKPREILLLPRGMRFSIDVEGPSRGYVLEIHQGHLQIPDLGPIGANGLAQPRDFLTPVAWYEDEDGEGVEWAVGVKFGGKMFLYTQGHSPYDVVAWHGNYVPYKYDLEAFVCMNSVTVDHPDPSIYTVLTCQSDTPGVAVADFVIFPPRWMAMHRSFRPPYYHRNIMTEYMGMIYGKYDAKVGFVPGGSSLHSCMSAHGPDAPTFAKASAGKLEPEWFSGGLAFMFETTYILSLTEAALKSPQREMDYPACWAGMPKLFDPKVPDMKVELIADTSAASGGGGEGSSSSSTSDGPASGGGRLVAVGMPITKSDAVPTSSATSSAAMYASYPAEESST